MRSLAFGAAVVLAMVLLLAGNIGMWAFSSLLDAPSLTRTAAQALQRPEVRARIAERIAAQLAPAMIAAEPLPPNVRRILDVPARPSQDRLEDALRRQVDTALADPATGEVVVLAAGAIAQGVVSLLEDRSTPIVQLTADGLVADLGPMTSFVLDRLDPTGALERALPGDIGRLRLVDADVAREVVPVVRLLDTLRWVLPAACVVVILLLLALARYRVHSLAWLGLAAVVAGTASLLAATGAPIMLPRMLDTDRPSTLALAGALEELTAGLVTQSAVLAGLGLALVVAGIAGGIVVSRGEPGPDARYGWDTGRLS